MNELSGRQEILLKMHEFYRTEARHQREMIWETVKWTTLVLLGMYGIFAKYMSEFVLSPTQTIKGWLALAFIAATLIPCVTSRELLRSFYQSNMRYITMYIKVEDELGFDKREKEGIDRHFLSEDNRITFHQFIKARKDIKTGEDFVKTKHKYSSAILYRSMSNAMIGFIIIDIIGTIYIIHLLAK